MSLARSGAESRERHGSPADPGRYFYTVRPAPRAATLNLVNSLMETCVRPASAALGSNPAR